MAIYLFALRVTGIIALISSLSADTVPCIDKSDDCASYKDTLCGLFELITYDTCRKSCNTCDGPVLDYLHSTPLTSQVASTTAAATTTQTSTVPTTPVPTTQATTTKKTTTTQTSTQTTTQTTTSPTTTVQTTRSSTSTVCEDKIGSCSVNAATICGQDDHFTHELCPKTCGQCSSGPTTVSTVCVDKIDSCSVNARVVCGIDYHFTYDLCRKTCGQCNGPIYTTSPQLTSTTTVNSKQTIREIECFYEGNSQMYDGKVSMTSPLNHRCINWANNASLNGYTGNQFPGGDFNHNYCRDPTNTGQPFCDTLHGTESCGIRKCAGPCKDSTTVSCKLFGKSACDDEEFSRTICPFTCNKCGYGIILQGRTT